MMHSKHTQLLCRHLFNYCADTQGVTEVSLMDVVIMIALELLLIPRVLYGGRRAVLLCRVDVSTSS
jgi:hypothetical protein